MRSGRESVRTQTKQHWPVAITGSDMAESLFPPEPGVDASSWFLPKFRKLISHVTRRLKRMLTVNYSLRIAVTNSVL